MKVESRINFVDPESGGIQPKSLFLATLVDFSDLASICKQVCILLNQKTLHFVQGFLVVGVAGFEPTTSSSRTKRATGLRYTPWITES